MKTKGDSGGILFPSIFQTEACSVGPAHPILNVIDLPDLVSEFLGRKDIRIKIPNLYGENSADLEYSLVNGIHLVSKTPKIIEIIGDVNNVHYVPHVVIGDRQTSSPGRFIAILNESGGFLWHLWHKHTKRDTPISFWEHRRVVPGEINITEGPSRYELLMAIYDDCPIGFTIKDKKRDGSGESRVRDIKIKITSVLRKGDGDWTVAFRGTTTDEYYRSEETFPRKNLVTGSFLTKERTGTFSFMNMRDI